MPTASLLRSFDRDAVLGGGLSDVLAKVSTSRVSKDQVSPWDRDDKRRFSSVSLGYGLTGGDV